MHLARSLSAGPLLAVSLLTWGCDAGGTSERKPKATAEPRAPAGSPSSTSAPTQEAKPGPPDPSTPCDRLSRLQCSKSDHCTVHWLKDFKYACRPDTGPCEVGVKQFDKAGCEAKGCAWAPDECWCNYPGYGDTAVPDVQSPTSAGACACGGGKPATCSAKP